MSTTAAATTPAPARSASLAIATGAWRAVAFVWKWVFGAALCTLFVGSLAVVGWTQRLMQRAVLRSWWRRSALRETTSFEDYVRRTPRTSDPVRWPNWFLAQRAAWTVHGVPRTLFHSLWLNLKLGCQSALNSWIGTAPAWSLWIFSWYAGWNNSFHKGYEQAWVGPTTGIVGSLFFAVLMLYVPLAQARQAATGRWRAFFELRVIRAIARERWLASFWLAFAYALVAVPVMVYRTAPAFAGNSSGLDALSDAELRAWLNGYWFVGCLFILFPAFVALRLAAARIYASALPELFERGVLLPDDLDATELGDLRTLRPNGGMERPERALLVRAVAWGGTRAGRISMTCASFIAWLGFVFLVYAAEFLNHHPVIGFLVHPLVQAPWFAYVPGHLGP